MLCASCGQENPDGFRFCGACGAALEDAVPAREMRKVVTIVFCDLTGSTALGDRTDPETLRATMRGYYDEMRTILERHGGTVEKFVGDAVMAVFGVPVSREDDALRAVRAAWEMREAVPRLGLAARIGVNTGEVVAGEGDTLVTGDTVNVAARLEQAADAGEVLIGAQTRRLVRDAATVEPIELELKGKAEPVGAFRVLDVDIDAAGIARRLDTPLVGRRSELAQLRQAFERAVTENRCHLFTLLGNAGVGKSRLVAEFLADVDVVLHGRCLDYGEGITFWPVVSVLKQIGPRADTTLAQLVEGGSSPNELFWALRTLLEEIAADAPLVVAFDDIHWGEPTFLDLLDHIADLSRGAPILLLCVARPELLDRRAGWGGGKLNATTALLEPLSADESAELIDAHGSGIGPETRTRILAAADGNPLFVEEMVALAREGGDVQVPATVQALLQARLDQLGTDERSVIERGAVEGQVFHRGAVRELGPGADVETQLVGLVRKELIRPETAVFTGDRAFRFRHLLVRDAAYDSLPKETRAELHERFATWLESHGRDLIELDEVVGYHLEQAARYRKVLGRTDRELASRAGQRLAEAGRKALGRTDFGGSTKLLERSLVLLDPAEPDRVAAALWLAEICGLTGELTRLDELVAEIERTGDATARIRARLIAMHADLSARGHSPARAQALLAEVVPQLDPADHEGRYWAAMVEYLVHWTGSRGSPALESIRLAVDQARCTGDRRLEGLAVIFVAAALAFAPTPVDEMEQAAAELEQRAFEIPAAGRAALFVRAFAQLYRGRFDEARALYGEVERQLLDVGDEFGAELTKQLPAMVELRDARSDDAIRILEPSYAWLRERSLDGFASTHAALLARAYHQSGRADDAVRIALEAEEISAEQDLINFAIGRGVRGRVGADRGELDDAERLAREAVGYALETDFPSARGNAYLDLAYVLGGAGRGVEAQDAVDTALGEFSLKGDAAGVAEAKGHAAPR